MLVSNLDDVPGQRIVKQLGLVRGCSFHAKRLGQDLRITLKMLLGGSELNFYTQGLQICREEAMEKMKKAANAAGANAVLHVRFSNRGDGKGATALWAYGVAVVVE